MVLILDSNSELGAHAWRKINLFGKKSTALDLNKYLTQIKTEIAPYVHTYLRVTMVNSSKASEYK